MSLCVKAHEKNGVRAKRGRNKASQKPHPKHRTEKKTPPVPFPYFLHPLFSSDDLSENDIRQVWTVEPSVDFLGSTADTHRFSAAQKVDCGISVQLNIIEIKTDSA